MPHINYEERRNMNSLSKIWNMIKGLNLIKYEITNGTIESHKFRLVLYFDGIINKGKTMTINQLANIVTSLAVEMREGFKAINARLNIIEGDIILIKDDVKVLKSDVKVLKEDVSTLKKEIAEHSDILKRNNLK